MQIEDVKTNQKRKTCRSRPSEITQRQKTGLYNRLPWKLWRKQRVNSYTNVSHGKQRVFVIKSHLTSTWSYTLYAHYELKRSVFQLFPLLCWRGVGGVRGRRPARLSVCVVVLLCWRVAWQKHTVQQVTGSRNDVLLLLFSEKKFCATFRESNGVSFVFFFCPWLLNSPLSWCGCIKVLVKSFQCVDVSS